MHTETRFPNEPIRSINQPADRRTFMGHMALAAWAGPLALAAKNRAKRVLLRSSWQTINIGDIAHTPGVLKLLEDYLPDVVVYLWPSNVGNGVAELLTKRFPKLKIVQGSTSLKAAFNECDFLLHGSGAEFVAEKSVVQWLEATGKPFGVYGITFPPQRSWRTSPTPASELAESVRVLNLARFVYFRDSESLRFAQTQGCTAPVMQFGPDGAFACDLRDDEAATAFLRANGLEEGKFLCCIPRLRFTPGWTIPGKENTLDPIKHARNEAMKEHDHAPLRQAIVEVIQQTDMKILICPEDQTQMQIGKDLLFDPLPASIKERVVWRPNYWLTGEAVSTYVRSAGLFGNELHSAIMCIGHGIPAVICRWSEQTSKGTMWRDIGLDEWLFDLDDEAQVQRVVPAVLSIARDPASARAKAAAARAVVANRQQETMQQLSKELAAIA